MKSSQFQKAMQNANLLKRAPGGKPAAGLYVIAPGWDTSNRLFKMGLTANIVSRTFKGYRHMMPYAKPGNSFRLVGFLVVSSNLVFPAEKRLLALTNPGFGFVKPPLDKEWRQISNPAMLEENVARLLARARRAVDGKWYVFDKAGKVVRQGGRDPDVEQNNVIPAGANVTTRANANRRAQVITARFTGPITGIRSEGIRLLRPSVRSSARKKNPSK